MMMIMQRAMPLLYCETAYRVSPTGQQQTAISLGEVISHGWFTVRQRLYSLAAIVIVRSDQQSTVFSQLTLHNWLSTHVLLLNN